MKLTSFHVRNFRSVNDSGPIDVTKTTALVGRNESGKSNILLALHSLNPPGGMKDLVPVKDFPRHRKLSECKDHTPVVDTVWSLDEADRAALAQIWPRIAGAETANVGRYYKGLPHVGFNKVAPLEFSAKEHAKRARAIEAACSNLADGLEGDAAAALKAAAETFVAGVTESETAEEWAPTAVESCQRLRKALSAAGVELSDADDDRLVEIQQAGKAIAGDKSAAAAARSWVYEHIPTFIYVADYADMPGHQDIPEYLDRKAQGKRSAADGNFEKLCKVAELDPARLHELAARGHEERNQIVNRAGAVVSTELRRLWTDRVVKVRFNLDGQHFDTILSDSEAVYDVEVNLDERSRGFRWFFSFYMTFAADTQGGSADNAILLLDEPGLFLHATSQGDLLDHLRNDLKNQVLYTTHSPFMVPSNDIGSVRTVSISQDEGTTVSNDPKGDSKTLFPLQAALGYTLSQSLFVGTSNIVVEGVTDYWVLSSVSSHLELLERKHLQKSIVITPAKGAQSVALMVSLLASQRLEVVVLLDAEKEGHAARTEMLKKQLLKDDAIVFVDEAFDPAVEEADIEDLLDPDVFGRLVVEVYAKELEGRSLTLNSSMPRIVKRYEAAFGALGLKFNKVAVLRRFMALMGSAPSSVMTPESEARFERLFDGINKRFTKVRKRDGNPFGA